MSGWGYGAHNGPDKWASVCPLANGDKQSPIDIHTGQAKKEGMPALTFKCAAEDSVTAANIGWTMKVSCTKGSEISGGPLGGAYKLDSFHFHWGATDAAGSEHLLDGHQFSAEAHIVYYNEKYGSFAAAADKPDGLCIVAVLCNAGADLAGISHIVDAAGKVSSAGTKTSAGGFDPKCLLPGNTNKYFCYPGSLTCPPCTENVEWIVMGDAISVSSGQLASFRTLSDNEGHPLVKNHRGCCPLKGRTVKKSF